MTEHTESTATDQSIPRALRNWFLLHFAIDMIVALPLFVAPREVLVLFGWTEVDPFAARLAAAALFAIGLESLFARNAGREVFKGMLRLKLVWSAFAAVGLAWSTLEGSLNTRGLGGHSPECSRPFTPYGGTGSCD